jgi:transglutaminase-like putative cysteine protease
MRYRIRHTTEYTYSEPASLSQNEVLLMPRPTDRLQVTSGILDIQPIPQYLAKHTDFFGNIVHIFMVQHPHEKLSITALSEVTTIPLATPKPESTMPWEQVAKRVQLRQTPEDLAACQFVFASPLAGLLPQTLAFAKSSFPPGRPLLAAAIDLMQRIFTEFTYDKTATSVDTDIAQVFAAKRGVCQDFSHLALSCLRSLGLAARYVSGYLETLPAPGKAKLIGADASHAWISIYLPDFGWVDLDPTNNILAGERHIVVGWGRDYGDVTPVKGVVMGGGVHSLSVAVDVAALEGN